jgi:integrative and conjugative element protein (TIGR02256 family)
VADGQTRWILIRYSILDMCQKIQTESQAKPETGGILMGLWRDPHMEITSSTSRGPSDKSHLYSFTRQDCGHQKHAEAAWSRSGGTVNFAGEWHSHPFGAAEPSSTDLKTWRGLVRRSWRPMVFIIVAPEEIGFFLVRPSLFHCPVEKLARIEEGLEGAVFSKAARTHR